MNLQRNLLLGLMTAASLSVVSADSFAQPPGRRGPPPGAEGFGPAGPEERAANLRTQLKINPAQENAFQAFLSATGAPDRPGRAERQAMQGMTAPQRLDAQIAQGAQRQADMKTRAEAAKRFYTALTVDQRAVFDALPPQAMLGLAPGGGGRMAMGGGRRGGGQGRPQGLPGAYDPQ